MRSPWLVTLMGLALAVPAVMVLVSVHSPSTSVLAVLAVLVVAIAAESVNVHVEFRRQSFHSSASELAFVIALLEVGGVLSLIHI